MPLILLAVVPHVERRPRRPGRDGWWQFLPRVGFATDPLHAHDRVLALFPRGEGWAEVEVPVCSSARPRLGCWVVARSGASAWRVTPARYGASFQEIAVAVPFGAGLPWRRGASSW